jgi:hypothetical protein
LSNIGNIPSADRIITGEANILSHLQKDYTNLNSTTIDDDRKTCRKSHFQDLGADGSILKCILKKQNEKTQEVSGPCGTCTCDVQKILGIS